MTFESATGWLTFLHRGYDLRLYRYELCLDDGNRAFTARENRTTYFGAITDRRILGQWDRNSWLPSSERYEENSSALIGKNITGVYLYDAETGELVDWYENGKWQQWEEAKANQKEVERRNNRKLRSYQFMFWFAAAVLVWAGEAVAGYHAGIAAGAVAVMIYLAIAIVENTIIVSRDAMFLLPR